MVALGVVICLLLAGFTYQQVASSRERRNFPGTGRHVDVAGGALYMDCRGEGGPTVVLEAGSGGSSVDWRLVMPGIARYARVCAYDRAGYGRSDPGRKPRSLGQMTSELHRLLQASGERPPFVLVGHSFGGILVTEYAARYRDEIAGFVFVDADTKQSYGSITAAYPSFTRGAGRLSAIAHLGGVAARFGLTRLLRQPVAPRDFPEEVRGEAYALGYQPKAYNAFADETAAFPRNVEDARTDFPRDVPVVVLSHGSPRGMFQGLPEQRVDAIWQREQVSLAQQFGNAQHHVVEGSGHFIQIDNPTAVINAVEAVVAEARR